MFIYLYILTFLVSGIIYKEIRKRVGVAGRNAARRAEFGVTEEMNHSSSLLFTFMCTDRKRKFKSYSYDLVCTERVVYFDEI